MNDTDIVAVGVAIDESIKEARRNGIRMYTVRNPKRFSSTSQSLASTLRCRSIRIDVLPVYYYYVCCRLMFLLDYQYQYEMNNFIVER